MASVDDSSEGAEGRTHNDWFLRAVRLSRVIDITPAQLQKKFPKHAQVFGVSGNYCAENAAAFEKALRAHVQDETTQVIPGTYRRKPVTHFFNPHTKLNVIRDASDAFESGWRLNADQERCLLESGALGGG